MLTWIGSMIKFNSQIVSLKFLRSCATYINKPI